MLDIHFGAGNRVSFGLIAVVIHAQYTWAADFNYSTQLMIEVCI